VSVLARRWDSNSSRPVEVHVTHLICKHLHLVGVQSLRVVENIEAAGRHGALASGAGHEVKVITGKDE
jgi:hypothetical protein